MQAYTSLDSTWIRDESVDLLGQTIIPLHNGKAEWDMGFKPTFANVSAADDWTKIFRQPIFYVEGTDASTSGMMRSQKLSIHLSNADDKVCPDGFVLSLDDAGAHRQGICSRSTCIVSIVLHLYAPGSHASINFLIDPNSTTIWCRCKPGKYSINPLETSPSSLSSDPSCLNCPAGGDCLAGGDEVLRPCPLRILSAESAN